MEKFIFFKTITRKRKEPEAAEKGPEAEKKQEIIKNHRGKRMAILKEILISRTADNIGNYIPGVDVVKMTIEGVIGKTLSRRELSGKEAVLYIVSSAMILGFYITSDPMLRLGASATFDAVMVPRIFKDVTDKISQILPQFGFILEKGQDLILQNKEIAANIFREIFTNIVPRISF